MVKTNNYLKVHLLNPHVNYQSNFENENDRTTVGEKPLKILI